MKVLALAALAGCHPMMPPPMVAFHGDTGAEPRGATTAMLVLGIAGQLFSDGVGVAVRVEHQDTTRRTTGVELTGGKDDQYWLVAARGYLRHTPQSHDFVAATYGVGLSYMSTGLVTGTVHAGGAVSYVNDYAQPFLATGLALAVPLRQPTGEWGAPPFRCVECGEPEASFDPIPTLETELFWYADAGLAVPIGDTGHQLSLDLGFAKGLFVGDGVYQLSVADRYTRE